MGILWNVFELCINILQGLFISSFITKTSEIKNKMKPTWLLLGIALAFAITLMNYVTMFETFGIFVYVLLIFIYLCVFSKEKILRNLVFSIIPLVIAGIVPILMSNIFVIIFDKPLEFIIDSRIKSVERFLFLIIIQIILLYLLNIVAAGLNKNSNLKSGEWLLLIIVFAISVVIAALLNLANLESGSTTIHNYIAISIIGLAILNVIIFYMIINLSKNNNAIKENEIYKIQQMHQQKYIKHLAVEQETIRKIRHDYKGNYQILFDLLNDNKIENAMQHIKQNIDVIEKIDTFINTDNDFVNSVINVNSSIANSMGIKVFCFSVSNFDGIENLDICNLLSNLLQNAISACKQCTTMQTIIVLKVLFENGYYILSIKNSIATSVLSENPHLNTSKNDKLMHGYGLKIVKDITEKYNGTCDFYEENDLFCVCVRLKKI